MSVYLQPSLLHPKPKIICYLNLWLLGFVTVSAGLILTQHLKPYIGNNSLTLSLISAIFILFMAFGVGRGGYYHRSLANYIKRHSTWAGLFIGLGLSFVFIEQFFLIPFHRLHQPIFITFMFFAVIIIIPLAFLLGTLLPAIIGMLQYRNDANNPVGLGLKAYAFGLFIGIFATNLLFQNYWGLAWLVFVDFLFLLLIAIFSQEKLAEQIIYISFILASSLMIYGINIDVANHLFAKYLPKNLRQAFAVTPPVFTDNANYHGQNNAIDRILFKELKLSNKSILALTGGNTLYQSAEALNNQVEYINLDNDVRLSLCDYMNTLTDNNPLAADLHFLIGYKPKQYDVIISDVYNDKSFFHAHLLTTSHMNNIRNALYPNGLAIFNVFGRPTLMDMYSKRVDNTIRSVFPSCMAFPQNFTDGFTNIIYFCQKSSEEGDGLVYSDNINSALLDFLIS